MQIIGYFVSSIARDMMDCKKHPCDEISYTTKNTRHTCDGYKMVIYFFRAANA